VSDEGEFAGLEAWIIEDWRRDGIHPAWIDVFVEKRLIPHREYGFRSEDEHRRWQEAVAGLHPDAGPADHPREFAKWRAHHASSAFDFCETPGVLPGVIEMVREGRPLFLAGYLEDVREELLAAVAEDDALRHEAIALAESVGGRELVEECRDFTSPVAQFVIALARRRRTT
jgi:hypothetical protein